MQLGPNFPAPWPRAHQPVLDGCQAPSGLWALPLIYGPMPSGKVSDHSLGHGLGTGGRVGVQSCSKWAPWPSSNSIAWELMRNADSQALPRATGWECLGMASRNRPFTSLADDLVSIPLWECHRLGPALHHTGVWTYAPKLALGPARRPGPHGARERASPSGSEQPS